MENEHTNKSEKIKNALVQTKTFALNLPFISHVRVFLDRKSKWEKLYGEANEKFADHKKQDELMLTPICAWVSQIALRLLETDPLPHSSFATRT